MLYNFIFYYKKYNFRNYKILKKNYYKKEDIVMIYVKFYLQLCNKYNVFDLKCQILKYCKLCKNIVVDSLNKE